MKRICFSIFAGLALCAALTSCNNNSEPQTEDIWVTMDFTLDDIYYTPQGYWDGVYNTEEGPFGLFPMVFSHKAEVTEFDGVQYKSFTGFCPSIVDDQSDHSGDDWTKYQFASIANPYMFGYLIAHWDVRENDNTPLEERSCLINFGYASVRPVAMTVTNTAYTYYAMKNGTAFSKPFTESDNLYLDVYGVTSKGVTKLGVSIPLARNNEFVEKWQQIDLTPLGEVQYIYFTMRSTDTGEYGMNVPAYFAIGSIQAVYNGYTL